MKKIIRLTESDLTHIVRRVIMEQSNQDHKGYINYPYKQKGGHSLVSNDGSKRYNLPVGHVWNHKCTESYESKLNGPGSEMNTDDWLEDSNGILFSCGDITSSVENKNYLKNYQGSSPLYKSLFTEYCSKASNGKYYWDDKKHIGCGAKLYKDEQDSFSDF